MKDSYFGWGGGYGVREQRSLPAYNHVHRTPDWGIVTSEDIAAKNIRALTGQTPETDRDADSPLTETLKWLAKRNMVSAGVRTRIDTLLATRWDMLKQDKSPEWARLIAFAKDSVGIKSNADRAVISYLDRLERALDSQE